MPTNDVIDAVLAKLHREVPDFFEANFARELHERGHNGFLRWSNDLLGRTTQAISLVLSETGISDGYGSMMVSFDDARQPLETPRRVERLRVVIRHVLWDTAPGHHTADLTAALHTLIGDPS